jgi:hypothetical protein
MRYRPLITAAVLVFIVGCTHHSVLVDKGTVTLSLRAPFVKNVQFASSLDSFVLHEARQDSDSNWLVRLPSDMQFSYFYLVDGEVFLPECTFSELDDFGSLNCVYIPDM